MSRFHRNGQYAALTLGAPGNILHIDYNTFKKSPQEKAELATHKQALGKAKHHKFVTIVKATV
jgi:hypothetical protein